MSFRRLLTTLRRQHEKDVAASAMLRVLVQLERAFEDSTVSDRKIQNMKAAIEMARKAGITERKD